MVRPFWLLREVALWFVAVIGAFCLLVAATAVLFGVTPLIFSSGSMSPGIPSGSLAIAVRTTAEDLVPGDIVSTIWSDGTRVTHRLVSAAPYGDGSYTLTTRGDANNIDDAEHVTVATADRVIWSMPGLGLVIDEVTKPQWVFTLGASVGGLVALAFAGARRNKRERATAARHVAARHVAAGRQHRGMLIGSSVVTVALVASLAVATPTMTQATFSNSGQVAGTFGTATITPPTITGCSISSFLGVFQSVTLTFTMPSGYAKTDAAVGTGGTFAAITPDVPGPTISGTGPYSITYSSSLLSTLLGSLFGSTTWIGVRSEIGTWNSAWSARKLTIGLAGLGSSCTTS